MFYLRFTHHPNFFWNWGCIINQKYQNSLRLQLLLFVDIPVRWRSFRVKVTWLSKKRIKQSWAITLQFTDRWQIIMKNRCQVPKAQDDIFKCLVFLSFQNINIREKLQILSCKKLEPDHVWQFGRNCCCWLIIWLIVSAKKMFFLKLNI